MEYRLERLFPLPDLFIPDRVKDLSRLRIVNRLREVKLTKGGLSPEESVGLAEARIKSHIDRHLRSCQVYLFGSRAKDNAFRRSDFDIAVLPNEGFDPTLFCFYKMQSRRTTRSSIPWTW